MQSDPVDEFDEILLKARAPMAAIARTVTGSDSPDAWSVELEPARATGEAGGVMEAGGRTEVPGARGDRGRCAGGRGRGRRAAGRAQRRRAAGERAGSGDRASWSGIRGMGALLVAEAGGEDGIVGVLAASWQHAIHVPGATATIQDLWVAPGAGAAAAVGRELVEAYRESPGAKARRQRIEVGLPRENFERDRRDRGLLPRQRLRAPRPADAEDAR